jgi:ribosomal protein S18 acetylase RimI-like enzyme
MIYRPATLQDITPRGIDLVKEATEETSWGDETFCPLRSLDTLTEMITNPGDLVAVAVKGTELAGVIIGTTHNSMFSPTLHASMCVWYVRPEHRGGWAGYRLARIYRDWARLMGATTAYFDVNSGVNNDLAGKLACKLGFTHIGETHKKVF